MWAPTGLRGALLPIPTSPQVITVITVTTTAAMVTTTSVAATTAGAITAAETSVAATTADRSGREARAAVVQPILFAGAS
jgi:hypothetical protein